MPLTSLWNMWQDWQENTPVTLFTAGGDSLGRYTHFEDVLKAHKDDTVYTFGSLFGELCIYLNCEV